MSKFTEIANKITTIKTNLAETITSKGVETSHSDTFENMINNINNIQVGSSDVPDITLDGEYQFPTDITAFRYVCSNTNYIFVYVKNSIYCFDKSFNYQWQVSDETYLTAVVKRVPEFFYADEEYVYLYTLTRYVKLEIATKTLVETTSSKYGLDVQKTMISSTGSTVNISKNGTTGITVTLTKAGSSTGSASNYNFNSSYNKGTTSTTNSHNQLFIKKFKDQDKMYVINFKNSSSSVLANFAYQYFGNMSSFSQSTMSYSDVYTYSLPYIIYNVYELGDNNIAIVSDGYITIKTINASLTIPKQTYRIQLPQQYYDYSSDIVVTEDGYIYIFDSNKKLLRYKIREDIVNIALE